MKHAAVESSLMEKILWILALALVAAALILGFQATGGPGYQRLVRYDTTRMDRARSVSNAIIHYYDNHNAQLPPSLEALVQENEGDVNPQLKRLDIQDPVSKTPFPYRILAKDRFELCLNYATEKKPEQEAPDITSPSISTYVSSRYYWLEGDNFSEHPKGPKCYNLKIASRQP